MLYFKMPIIRPFIEIKATQVTNPISALEKFDILTELSTRFYHKHCNWTETKL